jgi:drug/metabolite transporter (DMT)-like permease
MSLDIANDKEVQTSLFYIIILSIFGSAFAKILFNKFVQIASPVFASSVTYTLPIVAVMWGLLDGETINFRQILATIVILIGVYFANRKSRST